MTITNDNDHVQWNPNDEKKNQLHDQAEYLFVQKSIERTQ